MKYIIFKTKVQHSCYLYKTLLFFNVRTKYIDLLDQAGVIFSMANTDCENCKIVDNNMVYKTNNIKIEYVVVSQQMSIRHGITS